LVTDLGCGSGILAAVLTEAGYDVLGVDLSESMLALAADRAPRARFTRASLFTVEIPPCVAVTAVGECLNYDFSSQASLEALGRVFARVARCLSAHGVFLFDVAGPGRGGDEQPRETARVGHDWAVFARATEDASGGRLVRDITAFRRVGKGYRRSEERHTLRLYRPEDVRAELAGARLRAEPLAGYGPVPFPPGLHGFLAEPE
jgi:SAM-dependent methyltransferase